MSSRHLAFAPALALLAGCFVQSSSPAPAKTSSTFALSDMTPSMSAQSDGTSLKVYAALLKGGFIALDGGDSFVATAGGVSMPMIEDRSNDIHYVATFPAMTDAADVTISFSRGGGKSGAPSSFVHVAAPFDVTSPPPASFHRGDVLSFTVSPTTALGPTVTGIAVVKVNGPCLMPDQSYVLTPRGDGTATFDTSQVRFADETKGNIADASSCDVTVSLREETSGSADPGFAKGPGGGPNVVEGLQQRSFTSHITR